MLKSVAIAHFGSRVALAKALGVTKGAVSLWGQVIPEGSAYKLESLTKGALRVDPQLYAKTSARTHPNTSAHSS